MKQLLEFEVEIINICVAHTGDNQPVCVLHFILPVIQYWYEFVDQLSCHGDQT